MASKKRTALSSVFAPREVGLNRDTNLLKLVAMISMLIDHTGKMFFPQYQLMRIIGGSRFRCTPTASRWAACTQRTG